MNLFKKNEEDVKVIHPPVLGWLEKKLSDKEIDYLWKCIDNRKGSHKHDLAGNIHESNVLNDKADWFFVNAILPLCKKYQEEFRNLGDNLPTNLKHPYYLRSFWVNYQKQNEYNPVHNHDGVYSFVVWMKIPTKHSEQNKNPIASNSNSKKISTFNFYYSTILGENKEFTYEMNPEVEGTILFFPSQLKHCVYPFYNCGEDRISISGNISLNTAKVI
jgi:hypothetical protein